MNLNSVFRIDWFLLTPVIVLSVLGLTTLFTIDPSFFSSQLTFLGISLVVFVFFSNISLSATKRFSLTFYLISLFLLVVLLLIGINARGAVRWFDILGIRIQVSEVVKPFLMLSMAGFLLNNTYTIKKFLGFFVLLFPIALFITLQPDLGNALIYIGSSLLALLFIGFSYLWFVLAGIPFILALPLIWNFLRDYQKDRILTFINPARDPLGHSYNSIQAIIAVGSGMFFGRGFEGATQSGLRFLPERHNDFIFASLSEALGFLGSSLLILSFTVLLFRIFIISRETQDTYSKFFCIIALSFLLVQSFFNIGMNIGLLPIVGVTLPFVSYGGSSLLSSFILLGILSSISTSSKKRPDTLEIR